MAQESTPPPSMPRTEVFSIRDGMNGTFDPKQLCEDDKIKNKKFTMDPHSCSFRFIVLFFNCILTFGPYFCYDMPTVLQNELQGSLNETCMLLTNGTGSCCDDCLGLSPANYNLLFAVFSWVNAVTVLFTGYLTDKLGNTIAVLTFSMVTLVGTSIFTGATTTNIRHTPAMFPLMLVGRMLLGSGNGGMRIVQDRVTAFWFKDKELAMAFGIMLSFSRLGSVLNFFVTVELEKNFGMMWTFFTGARLCGLGFISAIILSTLDKYGIKKLGQTEDLTQSSKKVKVTDIRHFPLLYWLLVLTITAFYSSLLPFVANSSKFLQDEYMYTKTTASYIAGVVYAVALVFSPVFGLILDKFGRRGLVSIGCSITLLTVYILLIITNINPIPLIVLLGFSYTLAAISLWPSVAIVISPAHLGTAMGVVTCLLDVGRGISNLAVGKILGAESADPSHRIDVWSYVLIFVSCNAGVCLISAIVLNVTDRLKYKCLNSNNKWKPSSLDVN